MTTQIHVYIKCLSVRKNAWVMTFLTIKKAIDVFTVKMYINYRLYD